VSIRSPSPSTKQEAALFSEADYFESLEKPTYKTRDGKVFVGVILSADEVAPLEARLRGCATDWDKTQAAMRAVVAACFPQPWYRLGPNPVWSYIKKLPPPGQAQAVFDFIVAQVTALGLPKPSTPGTTASARADQEVIDGPLTAGS